MLFTLSVLQVHYLLANLLQLRKIFVARKEPLSLSHKIKLDPSHSLSLSPFSFDDFFNPLLQLASSCYKKIVLKKIIVPQFCILFVFCGLLNENSLHFWES